MDHNCCGVSDFRKPSILLLLEWRHRVITCQIEDHRRTVGGDPIDALIELGFTVERTHEIVFWACSAF